ncbi:PaaI family thioesterase [Sphingobium terrigena]|uniref:PaaI family thioesterase n=1 Tax=Sphingobium terrigena TaxID=2304063 RepID=UPI001EF13E95|nr:PaaI family thioesterase [Sphingobium terrigena]
MSGTGAIASAALAEDWSGWRRWGEPDVDDFLSVIGSGYARSDAPGRAQVALEVQPLHMNRYGNLHGGFAAGFADHAYFVALWAMGRKDQREALTIDLSMQYMGLGKVGVPMIADVELLKETGKMMFLRMTIAQGGGLIAASTATLRKVPAPK